MARIELDGLPANTTAGEVVKFLAERTPMDGKMIGAIEWLPRGASVEVADSHAAKAASSCDGAKFRDRRVRVRLTQSLRKANSETDLFDEFARLMEMEAEEERRQAKLAASENRSADDPFGASLGGLQLREQDVGLGGRRILSFTRLDRRDDLPSNRLQPGAPVLLTQSGVQRPFSTRGVVLERDGPTISVTIDDPDDDLPDDATWRLALSADEAARKRQLAALWRAQAARNDRLSELRDVLLGEEDPRMGHTHAEPIRFTEGLNEPQRDAISFALLAKEVAIIHGPPGTGKTTTVVEFIRQVVARGGRVLACAPSNAAVDVMLEKLLAAGELPVRLGHPARIMPALRERALDILIEKHPDAKQAQKFAREAYAKYREADRWTKQKPEAGEKHALRAEARELLSESRKLEEFAADQILDEAKILCATLTGLDSETLGNRRFDWAIIDEAGQSTEPACWIPILRADRVLLAGDPFQLPPTILSPQAAQQGLAISMLERLMTHYGPRVARVLRVQYRMHEQIVSFPSTEFYKDELKPDATVATHRLCELPGVIEVPLTTEPVWYFDTAGAGYDEQNEPETASRFNPQEAALIVRKIVHLLEAGVPAKSIAVITPYAGQVRAIRAKLRQLAETDAAAEWNVEQIEVDSVDGFQGREREAVLISLVRSNPAGEIGFLKDLRRTNVALTRARRLVLVVGDSATLANDPFYGRLIAYCESIHSYHTIWDDAEDHPV